MALADHERDIIPASIGAGICFQMRIMILQKETLRGISQPTEIKRTAIGSIICKNHRLRLFEAVGYGLECRQDRYQIVEQHRYYLHRRCCFSWFVIRRRNANFPNIP